MLSSPLQTTHPPRDLRPPTDGVARPSAWRVGARQHDGVLAAGRGRTGAVAPNAGPPAGVRSAADRGGRGGMRLACGSNDALSLDLGPRARCHGTSHPSWLNRPKTVKPSWKRRLRRGGGEGAGRTPLFVFVLDQIRCICGGTHVGWGRTCRCPSLSAFQSLGFLAFFTMVGRSRHRTRGYPKTCQPCVREVAANCFQINCKRARFVSLSLPARNICDWSNQSLPADARVLSLRAIPSLPPSPPVPSLPGPMFFASLPSPISPPLLLRPSHHCSLPALPTCRICPAVLTSLLRTGHDATAPSSPTAFARLTSSLEPSTLNVDRCASIGAYSGTSARYRLRRCGAASTVGRSSVSVCGEKSTTAAEASIFLRKNDTMTVDGVW